MSDNTALAPHTHGTCAGYGAPDSAHYKGGMAANYTSLHDFVDTFTSLDHVRRAFPNRKVGAFLDNQSTPPRGRVHCWLQVIISESWKAQQAQHNAKQIELFERLKQQVAAKAEAEVGLATCR